MNCRKWFEISEDELADRMFKQSKEHDAPVQKAVAILEAAIDSVLKTLGVDVTRDDVAEQMNELGIIMIEETREEMAGINGFYLFKTKKKDIIPIAWVGAAGINSQGKCFCEINWFKDERMSEITGPKIIQ